MTNKFDLIFTRQILCQWFEGFAIFHWLGCSPLQNNGVSVTVITTQLSWLFWVSNLGVSLVFHFDPKVGGLVWFFQKPLLYAFCLSHNYTIAAYCYSRRSVVCLSVCHNHEPLKAAAPIETFGMCTFGPKKPLLDGVHIPMRRANFWGGSGQPKCEFDQILKFGWLYTHCPSTVLHCLTRFPNLGATVPNSFRNVLWQSLYIKVVRCPYVRL